MAVTLTGNTNAAQQQKKQTNLPLQDPNNPNQPVQLVSQNQQQGSTVNASSVPIVQPQQIKPISAPQQNSQVQQVSNQSLIQANQQAQQGFQSPTAQLTTQQTQALLNDPNQGMNYDAYRGNQLSQYDSQQADTMEAARQGLAGASGSSLAQAGLMDLALKGIEGKANFTNELDTSIANQKQQNLLSALAAGRETTGMEQGISKQNLDALIAARNAAEPELNRQTTSSEAAMERGTQLALANQSASLQQALKFADIEGNKTLTELKAKLDSGLLTQEQDWKSAEAVLDRAAADALQKGDVQGQLQIEQLRGQIQAAAQQSAQQYQTAERVATQAYNTTERISTQDYQTAQTYLKQQIDQAAAEQDFGRQKYLQDKDQQLQLKMQTNDMQYGEKMAYLDYNLQEARANGDVGRQKQILTFQNGQEMERIRQEQGFQASMQYSQQQFEQAMQKGDFTHAETMLYLQQDFEAQEAIKNREVEYAKIALEQQGIDLSRFQAQFEMISQNDPDAAYQYLQSTLSQAGVKLNVTDALEKSKQAIAADFEMQKTQYALTHPGAANPDGSLTAEGAKQFYSFVNSNMYNEQGTKGYIDQITSGTFNAQQIRTDPEKLEAARQSAVDWNADQYKDKDGRNTYRFKTVPAANTPFNYNGQLLVRISDPKDISGRGTDEQSFTAMDLNTGKTVTIQTHS